MKVKGKIVFAWWKNGKKNKTLWNKLQCFILLDGSILFVEDKIIKKQRKHLSYLIITGIYQLSL